MKSDRELHLDVKALALAEAVQGIGSERPELIFPDQASSNFEDLEVLANGMAMDAELRVLVMAGSLHSGCRFMN